MSDYKVYYRNENVPGKEFPIYEEFIWNGDKWKILSLFLCREGMVIEFCKWIDLKPLKQFHDKWGKYRNSTETLSNMQYQELREDRMLFNEEFYVDIKIDNKTFNGNSLFTSMYDTIYTEGNGTRELQINTHYELGEEKPWSIFECSIPFTDNSAVSYNDLHNADIGITLIPDESEVFGKPINIKEAGQEFTVTNPVTNEEYRLKIKDVEWSSPDFLKDESQKYIQEISYTITPEISEEKFTLSDRSGGDGQNNMGLIYYKEEVPEDAEMLHTTSSYLYYEPRESLIWKPRFMAMLKDKITIKSNN